MIRPIHSRRRWIEHGKGPEPAIDWPEVPISTLGFPRLLDGYEKIDEPAHVQAGVAAVAVKPIASAYFR